MKRNHARINQTSDVLLQSWRGNCDVQILIYDSDPMNPDLAEIARVTDYVVAYSCKGNVTWREEIEQTRHMIMAAEDITGDKMDIKRIVKQVMNKAASKRIISKQESMVLLGNLPLVQCSEIIDSVSINNSKRLKGDGERATDNRFVTRYKNRKQEHEHLSLHQFYLATKPNTIPNFVGVNSTPRFPVTPGYARHTVIVHCPWREYPQNINWVAAFNNFISSGHCPPSCRMTYDRVMQRHIRNLTHYEPKSSPPDHSKNEISQSDYELAMLVGLPDNQSYDGDPDTLIIRQLDRGHDFKWDADAKVS